MLDAVAHNPFVMLLIIGVVVWLITRLGFGRAIALELSRGQRRVVWAVVVLSFLGNWLYVIARAV